MSKKQLNGKKKTAGGTRNVCVYCGSGLGLNPAYRAAAQKLGAALAMNNIGLVYGGGSLGLMGEVARATVDEIIVTEDMHQRKRLMFDRSDAFVALPGGVGTLEELVEQLTWVQLGRHTKPVVVANIDGFWTPFLSLLTHMKADTFIRPGLDVSFTVVDGAEKIVPAIVGAWDKVPGPSDEVVLAKF
jgi:predicted Rossmann-fold nucleotide-binding protein